MMIILCIKIFSQSFKILDSFYLKNKTNIDWEKNRISTNKILLDLVFTWIKTNRNQRIERKHFAYDQFKLDLFVEILNYHLRNRVGVYKRLGILKYEFFFVFVSIIKLYIHFFSEILSNFFTITEKLQVNTSSSSLDVYIGFPKHAFSNISNNSESKTINSFYEYLCSKNFEAENNVLSINEYERPSFKYEIDYKADKRVGEKDRIKIHLISRKTKNILIIIKNFIENVKSYRNYFIDFSPSFFYFFLRNRIIHERINLTLLSIEDKNLIKNIFLCSYFDIGLFKYYIDSKYDFKSIVYSDNIFHPMSSLFMNKVIENDFNDINFAGNEIFETDLYVYSLYHNNPIGFANNLIILNKLKNIINKKYKISLNLYHESTNYQPFNLGFERIVNLSLDRKVKNILIFDIPLFSEDQTFQFSLAGDIYGNRDFVNGFYNEIYKFSLLHKVKIYLKPKYSLNSPSMKLEQKEMIEGINAEIIDPYGKIIINDNMYFDLAIHFPFTSSLKVFKNLSKRNVYYIPKNYSNLFKTMNNKDVIVGESEFEQLFNDINLN
jgi:hypothetical protein